MNLIKCIICGENIVLDNYGSNGKCSYCGNEWHSVNLNEVECENLRIACDNYSSNNFDSAKDHFLMVAKSKPMSYMAWWGAFLSEYKIKLRYNKFGELEPIPTDLGEKDVFASINYRSAIKQAPQDIKSEYIRIAEKINGTNTQTVAPAHKFKFQPDSVLDSLNDTEQIYQFGMSLVKEADSKSNYFFAKKVFEKIIDYKNSKFFIENLETEWNKRLFEFKDNINRYVLNEIVNKYLTILNSQKEDFEKKFRLGDDMRNKIQIYTDEKQKAVSRINDINFEYQTIGFFGKKKKKAFVQERSNLINIITMCEESITIINTKLKNLPTDYNTEEYQKIVSKIEKLNNIISQNKDFIGYNKQYITDKKYTCVINDVITSDIMLEVFVKNNLTDIIGLNTDVLLRIENSELKDYITNSPNVVNKFKKDYQIKDFNLVTFGEYMQAEDGTKEPILWSIIKKEEQRTLLLSKKGLKVMPYNDVCDQTALWNTCSLKKFLCQEFYNESFSETEKEYIIDSKNKRADFFDGIGEEVVDSDSGNETERVFAITFDEFLSLKEENKIIELTDYAKKISGITEDKCAWWLKNYNITKRKVAGKETMVCTACAVTSKGKEFSNFQVDSQSIAVRPAIWVDNKFFE